MSNSTVTFKQLQHYPKRGVVVQAPTLEPVSAVQKKYGMPPSVGQ